MKITVNENIDEFKDDFYKGLTLWQTVFAAFAVAAGAAAFLIMNLFFGLPQSVALYAALPVVFPIAAAGFLKIHDMSLLEYLKARKEVRDQPEYHYRPAMLQEMEDREVPMDVFSAFEEEMVSGGKAENYTAQNELSGMSRKRRSKKRQVLLITEGDDES